MFQNGCSTMDIRPNEIVPLRFKLFDENPDKFVWAKITASMGGDLMMTAQCYYSELKKEYQNFMVRMPNHPIYVSYHVCDDPDGRIMSRDYARTLVIFEPYGGK